MKINKIFSIDSDLAVFLQKESNASALINALLHQYYDTYSENLDEKIKDLKRKGKEIKQKMQEINRKLNEKEQKERDRYALLSKLVNDKNQRVESWAMIEFKRLKEKFIK